MEAWDASCGCLWSSCILNFASYASFCLANCQFTMTNVSSKASIDGAMAEYLSMGNGHMAHMTNTLGLGNFSPMASMPGMPHYPWLLYGTFGGHLPGEARTSPVPLFTMDSDMAKGTMPKFNQVILFNSQVYCIDSITRHSCTSISSSTLLQPLPPEPPSAVEAEDPSVEASSIAALVTSATVSL